jgi:type II secretory pathway component GspD/PulD (secretin)
VKKQLQHLQALLGARRGLPLIRSLPKRLFVFLAGIAVITALVIAQSPDQTSESTAQPATLPSPAAATPPLPEPPLPPLGDAELAAPQPPPQPAPAPEPVDTILLEAQPLTDTPSPVASPEGAASSPFAAPAAPPQPTPPLRAADVAFPAATSRAQNEPLVAIGRPVTRTDYGEEGNRRAAQLRSMPPERFTFDRALLRDVLRFLAETAGIPFVSVPENSPQAQQLVTFRMTASPFAALESVSRQNEVKLVFEDGVWFMRVGGASSYAGIRELENANELVGVIYQLKHDPADRVDFQGQLSGSQNQQQATASTASASGGSISVTTPNLPLQNSQRVFVQRAPKLVNDVRAILGLKPLVYNEDGSIEDEDITSGTDIPSLSQTAVQGGGAGGGAGELPLLPFVERGEAGGRIADASANLVNVVQDKSRRELGISPVYVPAARPQVIYNSDSNFLWVVATRKQHKWVAEYLSKVDRPQDLIAIEVKFLETKKNPQYDFGINWGNMLGTGITVRGSANAGIGGEYGFGFDRTKEWGSTNFSSAGNGNSILGAISNAIINNQTNLSVQQILNDAAVNSMTGGSSSTNFSGSGSRTFNADFRGQNTAIPYEAVLSMDQVSVTLQAFMQDRDTSIVQYPRVLTLNNKEVAITSAENTPLNVGTSTSVSATGTSGTTVGQLGYLPTGTQINILPKVVNSNQIAMTVAITVSSVVGELPINLGTGNNLYPITSERVYNAALQVDSGNTLAVGGLEKVDDSNVQGGVPFLKDVPGLGYFFKNTNKKRNKVNLIIFITPYLIGDPARTPGISETPQSIVPLRSGVPPQAPTFTPDGRLSGGEGALENAFAWLDFQLRYFRQVNMESLTTLDSIQKLRDVIAVARALAADMQVRAGQPPYDPAVPAGRNALRAEELLADLNRALADSQENLM